MYTCEIALINRNSEKDIDEVWHSNTVFTNVSKGVAAKKDELKKCFGTEDKNACAMEVPKRLINLTEVDPEKWRDSSDR